MTSDREIYEGRRIAGRFLPVPTTVSRELAAAMAVPLDATEALLRRAPAPSGDWDAYLQEFYADADERIGGLLTRYDVRVTKGIIAEVPVHYLKPAQPNGGSAGRLLVHVHGGAYVVGGGKAGLGEAIITAAQTGTDVVSIDYRLASAHPFPAALEDVAAVWKVLVSEKDPRKIGVFGTSAGGSLLLSLCLDAIQKGVRLPAAIAPSTPWSDLAETGDSYFTNRGIDCAAPFYEGLLAASARVYANGRDLTEPLLSPVYGDFTGFPPTLLFTGTRDLFLSNTIRVHRRMRAVGVDARLHVFEGVGHGQLNALDQSAEGEDASRELRLFFEEHL